jgi:flagellar biosynthesis/type III secretory pathway chaperone
MNEVSQHAFKKTIMKTLSQHLKQAFNALEFANVSQLYELNARLNQTKNKIPSTRTVQRKTATERDAGTISPSNSPCF